MLEQLSFFLVLLVGIMGNQITLQVWPGNAVLRNKVVVALAFFQHLETMNSAPQFEYARRRTAGIPQICFLLLRVNDLTLAINKRSYCARVS